MPKPHVINLISQKWSLRLFCSKLREKSTLFNFSENFRENTKTKILTHVRGGASPSRSVIKCLMTTSQFIPVFPIRPVLLLVRNENLNYDFHFGLNSSQEFLHGQCTAVLCSLVLQCTRCGHIGFIQEIWRAKATSLLDIIINENTVLQEEALWYCQPPPPFSSFCYTARRKTKRKVKRLDMLISTAAKNHGPPYLC